MRAYVPALVLPLLGTWAFLFVYRLMAGGTPAATEAGFVLALLSPLYIDILFALVHLPVFLLCRRRILRPVWYLGLYTGPFLITVVTGSLMVRAVAVAPVFLSLLLLVVGYWVVVFRFSLRCRLLAEDAGAADAGEVR